MKRIFQLVVFLIIIAAPTFIFSQDYAKSIKKHRKSHKSGLQQKFGGPLKPKDLKQLDYFPASESWVKQAKVTLINGGDLIRMATSANQEKEYRPYATLQFSHENEEFAVTVYQIADANMYKLMQDHLFLPFTDLTNGNETYGGGRYLDLKVSDIEGDTVILDFNKSYNPYCVYADGWNCPIPPKENFINVDVLAGEKDYTGKRRKRR